VKERKIREQDGRGGRAATSWWKAVHLKKGRKKVASDYWREWEIVGIRKELKGSEAGDARKLLPIDVQRRVQNSVKSREARNRNSAIQESDMTQKTSESEILALSGSQGLRQMGNFIDTTK